MVDAERPKIFTQIREALAESASVTVNQPALVEGNPEPSDGYLDVEITVDREKLVQALLGLVELDGGRHPRHVFLTLATRGYYR